MEILVPIAMFAMIAAIVIAPLYFRSIERQKMAETLRAAIDKGQTLPSEVIEAFAGKPKPAPSRDRDLRLGVIWLAVAAGLAVLGLMAGFSSPDATYPLLGVAAFPGFIGIAFIVMWRLSKDKT